MMGEMVHRLGTVSPATVRKAGYWAQASVALALAEDGRDAAALAVIKGLDETLGLSLYERTVLYEDRGLPGCEALIASAKASRRLQRLNETEERRRAVSLIANHYVAPTPATLDKAVAADVALADAGRAYLSGDHDQARDKLLTARNLQGEAQRHRDQQRDMIDRATAQAERETVALARGEEIVTEDVEMKVPVEIEVANGRMVVQRVQRVTRTRNVTRDGLASLRQERSRQEDIEAQSGCKASGGITHRQYQAGMRYRALFEADDGGLGSQFKAILGGSRGRPKEEPVEKLKVPRHVARRVDAHAGLERLEDAVRAIDRSGRRLYVLREVAGRGRNLRELASSGSLRVALRIALAEALDTVVEELGRVRHRVS